MGCIAFLREKFRPKGGPCGGDGGHGGNIILQVNPQLSTLQDITLRHHYRAENGANGSGKNKHGKNGKDIIIKIPPGTIIKNADTEQVLEDLTQPNESYAVVKGGNGGFGNAPKFPKPHDYMFLLSYFNRTNSDEALSMVEYSLKNILLILS